MRGNRALYRLIKLPPRLVYAIGLGPPLGRLVLLLTTRGRRTGERRVTPLQYERVDGAIVVASARGPTADWYRNLVADPRVEVRIGRRRFQSVAEATTDAAQIADFLELRLTRHPKMVGRMLRSAGFPVDPDRRHLEEYASRLAMVTIRPR